MSIILWIIVVFIGILVFSIILSWFMNLFKTPPSDSIFFEKPPTKMQCQCGNQIADFIERKSKHQKYLDEDDMGELVEELLDDGYDEADIEDCARRIKNHVEYYKYYKNKQDKK